jgi:uncharacterized protein YjbJ (UPF0337 family)
MDKDRVEGKFDEMKGKVKEKVGEMTGNRGTQAEGIADQVKGKVQNTFGKAKDEVRAEDELDREERIENRRDDVA